MAARRRKETVAEAPQQQRMQPGASMQQGAGAQQGAGIDPRMLQMMMAQSGGMGAGGMGAGAMGAASMQGQPAAAQGMGAGIDPRLQMMQRMRTQSMQRPGMGMQGQRVLQGMGAQGMGAQRMSSQQRPQPYAGGTSRHDDPARMGAPAPVDRERIKEATRLMLDYKAAKSATDERIVRNQEWWRQRNWSMIEAERGTIGTQPRKTGTGWLKTAIIGQHADYMEAFPAPIFLARNAEDEAEAEHLSEIVPVVLAQAGFDDTYSACGWQKLTEGTGVYAVTWDGKAQHGMGEVSISKVNALNLYAEPGVEDIQDSSNVFMVRMEDNRRLVAMYPQLEGKLGRQETTPVEYVSIDRTDKSDKTLLVDWYYKKQVGGKTILHYCKYCADEILYASENDPKCQQQGYYHHGLYPFELDAYLPDAGTIWGQGSVDLAYGTQMDIDAMSQAMVTNAQANATPRYFSRGDSSINEDEFLDWSRPIVHTDGNLGQDSLARVEVPQMDGNTLSFYTSKIEELKFVLGNTEILNGDAPAGITSGVALAALRETAGRQAKDSNRSTYRTVKRIYLMVVELIRQFYKMDRQFRIVGEDGSAKYKHYNNARLQLQTERDGFGVSYRLPQFDVDVHVQRENAYTRMAINDMATQFYQMGIFNPMAAPQALMMLQMMDFTGKEKLVKLLQQNFMSTMMQMGGMAPAQQGQQQAQQGAAKPGEGKPSPTQEDATEETADKSDVAHTPATNRIEQRVNDAVRP